MAGVYTHFRKDKNTIFYVGIFENPSRPFDFNEQRRNQIWNRVKEKTEIRVDIVAENLTWEEACEMEVQLISYYGRKDKGDGELVNLTDGGDGAVGIIKSEETRKKLSESLRGRKLSEETKHKVSETLKDYFKENPNPWKGKKHSEETLRLLSELAKERPVNFDAIEAMRNKNIGGNHTEEHRKKLSEKAKQRPPMSQEVKDKISKSVTAVQTGRPCKEETKLKISQKLMGHKSFRTGPTSEETKKKISDAQKGKKLSDEHRLKLSIAAKNRKRGPMSEETKRKIGDSNRKK